MSCARLAEVMSVARLESATPWEGGMWAGGALLVLRLRDAGDSDFGVDATDEAAGERATERTVNVAEPRSKRVLLGTLD